MGESESGSREVSRRSFIKASAATATGAAIVGAPAAIALERSSAKSPPPAVVSKPSGPLPSEPLVAYVRDAKRGEVTVVKGTTETTYRDPVLVERLVNTAGLEGGN